MVGAQSQCHVRVLENGLTVIMIPKSHVSHVAVDLSYHVGAKDEDPARTGVAHLLEHMMFEGSRNHPHSFSKVIERSGGRSNAGTSYDRTRYWSVIPSAGLAELFWLEAERMHNLIGGMRSHVFQVQRDVASQERLENYENTPLGQVQERLNAALFGATSPYGWPVIGWLDDIRRLQASDLEEFYVRHYGPQRASIAIAGAFDPSEVIANLEKTLGRVPQSSLDRPLRPVWEPYAAQTLEWGDRVKAPRLYLSWRAPAFGSGTDAHCDVLAEVLGGMPAGLLCRRLMGDGAENIAFDVRVRNASREHAGVFTIEVGLFKSEDRGVATALIKEELDRIARAADVGMLDRANQRCRDRQLATEGSIAGLSATANCHQLYRGGLSEWREFPDVTVPELASAAQTFLSEDPVVATVVPADSQQAFIPVRSLPRRNPSPAEAKQPLDLGPKPNHNVRFRVPELEQEEALAASGCQLHHAFPRFNQAREPEPESPWAASLVFSRGTEDVLPLDQQGLGRLFEVFCTKADALSCLRALDRWNGHLQVRAERQQTVISVLGPTKYSSELFATLLSTLQIRGRDGDKLALEGVKATFAQGLATMAKRPHVQMDVALKQLAFGSEAMRSQFRYPTERLLASLRLENLYHFRDQVFSAPKLDVLIASSSRDPRTPNYIETLGSAWSDLRQSGATAEERGEDNQWDGSRTPTAVRLSVPHARGVRLANVGLVWTFSAVSRRQRAALGLISRILSSGMDSHFNRDLRQARGQTYGVRSQLDFGRGAGSFRVALDCRPDSVEEVVASLRDRVARKLHISAEEVQYAQARALSDLALNLETPTQIMKLWLARCRTSFDLPGLLREEEESLGGLTAADLEACAERFFSCPPHICVISPEDLQLDLDGFECCQGRIDFKTGRLVLRG